MQTSIGTLVIIAFLSFSQTYLQKDSGSRLSILNSDCQSSAIYGGVKYCMPFVDGMLECYSNPNVKSRVELYNYGKNSNLAYYVNEETFKNIDNFKTISVDDYFQVFALTKAKDVKADYATLKYIAEMMRKDYKKADWEAIKSDLETFYGNLSLGTPVLIENYSPTNFTETMVNITKIKSEIDEEIFINVFNTILIKDRIIWVSYNKTYDGVESIRKAKAKNDYFVHLLLSVNK